MSTIYERERKERYDNNLADAKSLMDSGWKLVYVFPYGYPYADVETSKELIEKGDAIWCPAGINNREGFWQYDNDDMIGKPFSDFDLVMRKTPVILSVIENPYLPNFEE